MKKRIMATIIFQGLASLATAQTTPQNIINAKISEGYYALSLTERAIPADVLRQNPNLQASPQRAPRQQNPKERNITKMRAGLNEVHKGKAGRPTKGNETKTRNTRTIYN